MKVVKIKVHADSLQYTPEGLRTLKPIPLEPGCHNQVVIQRPTAVEAVPVGLGGFGLDSSFPTPVSLALLISPSLRELFGSETAPTYQVYGHASRDGKVAHNKALSDRRAAVVHALLLADIDAFEAVAAKESWGPAEQQVMLRVLHCDPGPIDGVLGSLSRVAVYDFQEDYNDGIFHRHADTEPRDSGLSVDGILGPKTNAALLDAFVHACSPLLTADNLHPTHPVVGCSEFNGLPGEDPSTSLNRRATLIVHETLPEFHDQAPCVEGDHSVCPVDGTEPQRCPWYRAHVDEDVEQRPHLHTDLRWLPLADGRVLLSSLTTLPDGEAVEFRVHRSAPLGGPEDISEAVLDRPITEALEGSVTMGVAQVVWAPDEGLDPFDFDAWYPDFDYDQLVADPLSAFGEAGRLRPPLFTVTGGGHTAVSEPPGQQFHRLRFSFADGNAATEGKTAWGVDNYGRVIQTDLEGRRVAEDMRAIDENARVMHFEPFQYRPTLAPE